MTRTRLDRIKRYLKIHRPHPVDEENARIGGIRRSLGRLTGRWPLGLTMRLSAGLRSPKDSFRVSGESSPPYTHCSMRFTADVITAGTASCTSSMPSPSTFTPSINTTYGRRGIRISRTNRESVKVVLTWRI